MKKILSLAALSLGVTLAAPLAAAEPCYLALKANGAAIDGEATQRGREKTIECIAFEYEVNAPRDAATGMATGKRTYGPVKCTKRVDKTSPLLLKAMAMNQVIEAQFRFYRATPSGQEDQFYTVSVKNARIASIKQHAPSSAAPETQRLPFVEEVSFTFGEITVQAGPASFVDNPATAR